MAEVDSTSDTKPSADATGGGAGGTDAAEKSMEATFDKITKKQMRIQENFAKLSTELSIAKKQIQ